MSFGECLRELFRTSTMFCQTAGDLLVKEKLEQMLFSYFNAEKLSIYIAIFVLFLREIAV